MTETDVCSFFDDDTPAIYISGRQGEEEAARFEEHYFQCDPCFRAVEAGLELRAVLVARARRLSADAGRGSWRSSWIGLAAAAVIASSLAIWSARTRPPRRTDVLDTSTTAGKSAEVPAAPSNQRESGAPDGNILKPGRANPPPKRSGQEMRISGKVFHLEAGEWIDSSFDAMAALPEVEISGDAQRMDLLRRLPELAPYLAPGRPMVIVYGGTVYRVRP